MKVILEVKCTGSSQPHEGHHTSTFVGAKDEPIDALRQEVKIIHPEMPFKIGELYSVSIEAKNA